MRLLFSTIILAMMFSCKEAPKASVPKTEVSANGIHDSTTIYPTAFIRILEVHGGLQNWRAKRTLSFEISSPDAPETHIIDLYSRKDKIALSHASMGFDGEKVWLADPTNSYKGNPTVYHNLMFYFYAMPFVFADKGINYEDTEDLIFEGKNHPGIHVSFDEGIGASPKDDYYLHYDPDDHQMAWLGYTFTYGSEEKSKSVNWIHYSDWVEVDGIRLPRSITWHASDGKTIKGAKNTVVFENILLNEESKPNTFFEKPKSGVFMD